MASGATQRQAWIIDQIPLREGDRVLELGSGHGVAASLLCDRLGEGAYLGLDRSLKMTAAASDRNRRHVAEGRATFQTTHIVDADLDGIYDWVLAIHLPVVDRGDPREELAAIRPHMTQASRFCIGFQPLDASALEAAVERLDGVLELNGFNVIKVSRGDPDGRPTAVVFAETSDR